MEWGKLVKPNVLNKPVQDASDLIRSKQKKQESRARGEYELRTIMKKITTIAETRGSHKEYHVANFATFVSKTLTFSLQKMDEFNFRPAQYCINKIFECIKSCIWVISKWM